jgi:hypothetical protein
MSKTLLALLALGLFNIGMAQDQVYYKSTTFETPDYTIVIEDAISTYGSAKFKLKLTNKTSDFLLLKPSECVFKINGKNSSTIDNELIVGPNATDTRNFSLPGNGMSSVRDYIFVLSGIYKIGTNGTVLKTPDFKIPPAETMVVKAGVEEFICTMDTLIKQSEKTFVAFDVEYTGSKIGMINTSKPTLKLPNGNEFPNQKVIEKGKTPYITLLKGQKEKISMEWNRLPGGKATDMAKLDMTIVFKETFSETTRQKMPNITFELKYDEVKNTQ